VRLTCLVTLERKCVFAHLHDYFFSASVKASSLGVAGGNTAVRGGIKVSTEFDKFWSSVWLKVGKGDARRAFKVARRKADLQTIIDGAQEYGRWLVRERKDRQFWAHPATWLRGERWDDELSFTPPPSPTPICGSSGYDADSSIRRGQEVELERRRAVVWLEGQDEDDVCSAFELVKMERSMFGGPFESATWRDFPVWTARRMGYEPLAISNPVHQSEPGITSNPMNVSESVQQSNPVMASEPKSDSEPL